MASTDWSNSIYRTDPVYGIIEISALSGKVIEHPYFVRLKQICQLSTVRFVHPTATHTRYEHSIGVASLTRLTLKTLYDYDKSITETQQLAVEMSALHHDCGHFFGHTFDVYLRTKLNIHNEHETRSRAIAKCILTDMGYCEEFCDFVGYLIDPSTPIVKWDDQKYSNDTGLGKGVSKNTPPYITSIVANHKTHVDTDKEYLIRDALYLSVGEKFLRKIDFREIIKRSQVIDNEWVFSIQDQLDLYELVSRRYIFHSNYYGSEKAMAADLMLFDLLDSVNHIYKFDSFANFGLETSQTDDEKSRIEKFCSFTDDILTDMLNNPLVSTKSKNLIQRLVTGDFYTLAGVSKHPINKDIENYTSFEWRIQKDNKLPHKILPLLNFHENGKLVENNPRAIHRIFKRD